MKLYVAYGSNLNIGQMKYRCPDAKIAFTGVLKNWELIYRGSKSGAYATIQRKAGSIVPVAVWYISSSDEFALDRYEGYPRFYQKQNVYVSLPDNSRKKAMVYIMSRFAKPGRPSSVYVSTVRQGYKDTGLNTDYLDDSLEKNLREIAF